MPAPWGAAQKLALVDAVGAAGCWGLPARGGVPPCEAIAVEQTEETERVQPSHLPVAGELPVGLSCNADGVLVGVGGMPCSSSRRPRAPSWW